MSLCLSFFLCTTSIFKPGTLLLSMRRSDMEFLWAAENEPEIEFCLLIAFAICICYFGSSGFFSFRDGLSGRGICADSSLRPKLFVGFMFRWTALLPLTKSGTPLSLLTSARGIAFYTPLLAWIDDFLPEWPRVIVPLSKLLDLLTSNSFDYL